MQYSANLKLYVRKRSNKNTVVLLGISSFALILGLSVIKFGYLCALLIHDTHLKQSPLI